MQIRTGVRRVLSASVYSRVLRCYGHVERLNNRKLNGDECRNKKKLTLKETEERLDS